MRQGDSTKSWLVLLMCLTKGLFMFDWFSYMYVCMYVYIYLYIYIYANKLATPATPNYSRIYCHHWMWASLRAIAKLM